VCRGGSGEGKGEMVVIEGQSNSNRTHAEGDTTGSAISWLRSLHYL
jgi:hypothetical protein